jgi:hypothetical protein
MRVRLPLPARGAARFRTAGGTYIRNRTSRSIIHATSWLKICAMAESLKAVHGVLSSFAAALPPAVNRAAAATSCGSGCCGFCRHHSRGRRCNAHSASDSSAA